MPRIRNASVKESGAIIGLAPSTGRSSLVLTVATFLLLVNTVSSAQVATADARTSSIVEAVSGLQIMDTIKDLEDFGTRAFYLESTRAAGEYVYDKFAEFGLHVEHQNFTLGTREISNIIAVLSGTSPDAPSFLFGAHYDSENSMAENYSDALNMSAPGADDDASGVAAIVELARVLAGVHLRNTIKFVAFTAEEYGYDSSGGLRGSTYYVAQEKAAGAQYIGTAILDMIGYKDSQTHTIFGIVNKEGDAFAEHVVKAVDKYKINLTIEMQVAPTITFSDHSPFWRAGYPSILFIEELSESIDQPVNPFYHTSNDTSNRLSEDQIEEVTRAMAAGLLELVRPQHDPPVLAVVLVVGIAAAAVVAVLFQTRRKVKG